MGTFHFISIRDEIQGHDLSFVLYELNVYA